MAFDLTGLSSIADIAGKVLDRFVPDPAQKAAATLELLKAQQAGEFKAIDADLQAMQAQMEVNKVEAGSSSLFVSGWRPAVGWVCAGALFSQYILRPWVQWVCVLLGHPIPQLPGIDDQLWQLLGAMLGMGGLRTFEKLKGVSK
jgi:hypothetical protein